MKTTKLFSILSLALIFAATYTGFAKKVENPSSRSTQPASITYQVVVHNDYLSAPCGTYVIKVVDESGRLVAPVQVFTPGISKYSFKEKFATKTNKFSRRMATLEPVKYPHHYVCANPLFVAPDVAFGPFLAGQTYFFDLYPKADGQNDGSVDSGSEQ